MNKTSVVETTTHDAQCKKYENLIQIPRTPYILRQHTIIRNATTPRMDFQYYSEQQNRIQIENAQSYQPYSDKEVITPTEYTFQGQEQTDEVIGVSIMRAGEAMESAQRSTQRGVRVGKIQIQRDEMLQTKQAKLFYSKLPKEIQNCTILLLDPMLATGSSASLAIKVLMDIGVQEKNILFVNLIAAPEGIDYLFGLYPSIRIVTTMIDSHQNEDKYIIPGIGDYGDRYVYICIYIHYEQLYISILY